MIAKPTYLPATHIKHLIETFAIAAVTFILLFGSGNVQTAYAQTKLHLESEIYIDRVEAFRPYFKDSSCKQLTLEKVSGNSVSVDWKYETITADTFGKTVITISWKECAGADSTVETQCDIWCDHDESKKGKHTYLTLGATPYSGKLYLYDNRRLVIANEEEYDIGKDTQLYTATGQPLTWHDDAVYCKKHKHFTALSYMTARHKSETFNVVDAHVVKMASDNIFTGRAYSFGTLCNAPRPKGSFSKGTGYKVVNGGSKVVFTSTGKKTVNYRHSGKIYKIKYIYPHSVEKLKSQTIAAIKRKALIPGSFQLKSAKFNKSNGIMDVRFTVRNAYGVRVSQSAEGYYFSGKFDLSW